MLDMIAVKKIPTVAGAKRRKYLVVILDFRRRKSHKKSNVKSLSGGHFGIAVV